MSRAEKVKAEKIRCDACPVMCYIAEGRAGACDRYANRAGELVRLDPLTVVEATEAQGGALVPFLGGEDWDGDILAPSRQFVTAVGAGTTYPDYKPAPFIVAQEAEGVDMVTIVTEGIFSYCGVKVKIDTDRHIGDERAPVRVEGEIIGHVMTGEYGSRMLSLGGVDHLTGGSKAEGRVTCAALLALCNREAVEMQVEGGARLVVQAGRAPVIDGEAERLMRVGCGSAAIGMFASEHQAGKMLDIPPTGISIRGRRSTPGRYFQVAEAGTGWGGTDITDPLTILGPFKPKESWPGLRLLMVSTTGEQWGYYELDEGLKPRPAEISPELRAAVERVAENCEPAMCSVLFMAGAGGSLRAGVTENPVRLTRSVKEALTYVSCGGAPAYVWPGGGITFMVDVMEMPSNSFGYVPTPALVAPIEFTLRLTDYAALGGHMAEVRRLEDVLGPEVRRVGPGHRAWPTDRRFYAWGAKP
ncbi:MAG: 6-hydroxynicotinate reductase [Alphaproteobacteria bacterium HGW-Alphaproteobacteria-2]|nr:MAG: 6-hydroxynicotinate reductase [Alphaproteobacteria bacterium HGW-Alphaproteobacteria-2]